MLSNAGITKGVTSASDDSEDNSHFSRNWLESRNETRHGPSPALTAMFGQKAGPPPFEISSLPQSQGPTSPTRQNPLLESSTQSHVSGSNPSPAADSPSGRRAAHGGKHKASPMALERIESSKTQPISYRIVELTSPISPRTLVPMSQVIDSMASLSRAGMERSQRKTNQDSLFAYRHYLHPHQALAGILDGHGPHGHYVSNLVKQQLPLLVGHNLQRNGDTNVGAALRDAFIEAQNMLQDDLCPVNARFSGTTAVVAFLQGRQLTTAWVGDSRAVLLRRDKGGTLRGVALTDDHKPINAGEFSRIIDAGGQVERLMDGDGNEVGPHRVWMGRSRVPGLAMSRALGDLVAHSVGVIAEPDVHCCELTESDEFLIVASDGVWEFITTEEVAGLITGYETAGEACELVVEAASERWKEMNEMAIDDISVVVAKFITSTTVRE